MMEARLFNRLSVKAATRENVLSILPSRTSSKWNDGATLGPARKWCSRSAEEGQPGRFPQVAGVRFTFDAGRAPGSRVVDVTVNGQPLDDNKKYTLATTDFLAIDGGDGYAMLKGARLLISPQQGQSDFDILRRAVVVAKSIVPI